MRRIAVEEHGSTKEYTDYLYSSASKGIPKIEIVEDELPNMQIFTMLFNAELLIEV